MDKIEQSKKIVIKKHTKTDDLSFEEVRENPSQAITHLLRGFVSVSFRDTLTDPSERDPSYNSNKEGWRTGERTLTLICAFENYVPENLGDIRLVRETGLFDDEQVGLYPLSEVYDTGKLEEYSKIHIANDAKIIAELTQHTAIYGGKTDASEPLQPLYIGEKIKPHLPSKERM